jgi:hypothetical protein
MITPMAMTMRAITRKIGLSINLSGSGALE